MKKELTAGRIKMRILIDITFRKKRYKWKYRRMFRGGFRCYNCNKKFKTKGSLDSHIKFGSWTCPRECSCIYCHTEFRNPYDFDQAYHDKAGWGFDRCKEYFKEKQERLMAKKIKNDGYGERIYKADQKEAHKILEELAKESFKEIRYEDCFGK